MQKRSVPLEASHPDLDGSHLSCLPISVLHTSGGVPGRPGRDAARQPRGNPGPGRPPWATGRGGIGRRGPVTAPAGRSPRAWSPPARRSPGHAAGRAPVHLPGGVQVHLHGGGPFLSWAPRGGVVFRSGLFPHIPLRSPGWMWSVLREAFRSFSLLGLFPPVLL